MPEQKKSELVVITKAKELCAYVMTVTQKSPKQFRFTFVARMQNLSLDVIESLFRANDTYVSHKGDMDSLKIRLDLQHRALSSAKLLMYIAYLSMEQGCILPKQYEQISKLGSDCQNLIGAWITSDKKRFSS